MTERLILLPGWGLGSLPLEVLAEALRGLDPALRVEIEPLPELHRGEPRDWLPELAGALRILQPNSQVGLIDGASHAFPLEYPHEVAAAMQAFMREAADD